MFIKTYACKNGIHCKACRAKDSAFREALYDAGMVDEVAFECPFGVPWGGSVDDRTSEPVIDRGVSATPRKQSKPRKPRDPEFLKCEFYNPEYSDERKSGSKCGCLLIQCRYNFIREIKSRLCYGSKCDNFAAVSEAELAKRKTDYQKKLLKLADKSV